MQLEFSSLFKTPPICVDANEEEVWIYGFIEKDTGIFVYVGQTMNPSSRLWDHKSGNSHVTELNSPGLRSIILRKTTARYASIIEARIIAALKRRGECRLNKNKGSPRLRYGNRPGKSIESSNGMIFKNQSQAARYFGVCLATIYQAVHSTGLVYGRDSVLYSIWLKKD